MFFILLNNYMKHLGDNISGFGKGCPQYPKIYLSFPYNLQGVVVIKSWSAAWRDLENWIWINKLKLNQRQNRSSSCSGNLQCRCIFNLFWMGEYTFCRNRCLVWVSSWNHSCSWINWCHGLLPSFDSYTSCSILSWSDLATVVHVLFISHLEHCNAIYMVLLLRIHKNWHWCEMQWPVWGFDSTGLALQ